MLEALGLPLPLDERAAGDCLAATGFTFLFAPHYHPAMKEVAPVRRELGVRTVFNLLGPLDQPGRAALRPDRRVQRARRPSSWPSRSPACRSSACSWSTARRAGTRRRRSGRSSSSMCGRAACRESCAIRATSAWRAARPRTSRAAARPENAAALRAVFEGRDRGPHRDALALNAALALEVTGAVVSPVQWRRSRARRDRPWRRRAAARAAGRSAQFGTMPGMKHWTFFTQTANR